MSLPAGFLDELRSRTSLAQIVGRKVAWDLRKSNQGKGDMWAPCPFHQEKTASFHVDDPKGFYYCFGCHAKGDAISFVREIENMDFMEAVRFLAADAGMEVPRADPREAARADKRSSLSEIMEQAVQYFRLQLQTASAGPARDYLSGRGLDGATLEQFEIGFAPDARQGLLNHFKEKGVAEQHLFETGLCAEAEDGRAPYDRFRGRIMFPIRDARGRSIAFGGRSLDPNARAKYLNSPETVLFDKSRTLYNLASARRAVTADRPLVVAEGYMDVIALTRAGIEASVAPLGTAITEEQLHLMWRVHHEPVIALDGDKAGLRAAYRLIDLALPLLSTDRTLRFAVLPEGKDPDDLLASEGRGAVDRLISSARPLLSLLWQRETENKVLDSPERRAAVDQALRRALGQITDKSVRDHFGHEVRQLRSELFQSRHRSRPRKTWKDRSITPLASTRQSLIVRSDDAQVRLREAVILATLVTHPSLIEDFEPVLESVDFGSIAHRALAGELMRSGNVDDLKARITGSLGAAALENLFALRHVQIAPGVRKPDDREAARLCLAEEFAKLESARGREREITEAIEDMSANTTDEGVTWRLSQAAGAYEKAARSGSVEKTEYDVAPTGARMDKDERKLAHDLFESIDFAKGRRETQK